MNGAGGGGADLSSLLGGLLANPSALSAISGLLGNLSPPTGDKNCVREAPFCAKPAPPEDPRVCLINALRPFLPPEKCELINSLLHVLDLLRLLQNRR